MTLTDLQILFIRILSGLKTFLMVVGLVLVVILLWQPSVIEKHTATPAVTPQIKSPAVVKPLPKVKTPVNHDNLF